MRLEDDLYYQCLLQIGASEDVLKAARESLTEDNFVPIDEPLGRCGSSQRSYKSPNWDHYPAEVP